MLLRVRILIVTNNYGLTAPVFLVFFGFFSLLFRDGGCFLSAAAIRYKIKIADRLIGANSFRTNERAPDASGGSHSLLDRSLSLGGTSRSRYVVLKLCPPDLV